MPRLIDADALRKRMFSYYGCVNENSSKEYYRGETLMNYEVAYLIEDCIDDAPTIEAEPVKHWINIAHEKPPCRGHYFIAYKFQGSDMRFYGEAFWHDDIQDNGYVKGDHFSNEGVDGMYVTHWMKIPTLPNCGAKMDEEDNDAAEK